MPMLVRREFSDDNLVELNEELGELLRLFGSDDFQIVGVD
jgi:hypothetical protein